MPGPDLRALTFILLDALDSHPPLNPSVAFQLRDIARSEPMRGVIRFATEVFRRTVRDGRCADPQAPKIRLQ